MNGLPALVIVSLSIMTVFALESQINLTGRVTGMVAGNGA